MKALVYDDPSKRALEDITHHFVINEIMKAYEVVRKFFSTDDQCGRCFWWRGNGFIVERNRKICATALKQ